MPASISIHHLISFRGPAAGPTINESGDGVPQRLVSSRRDFLRRPVSINQYGAGLRNNFAPCHKRRPNRVWSSRMRLSAPCWRWPLETLAPPMRIGFFIFTSAPSTATLNSPPCSAMLSPGPTRCGGAPIAEEVRRQRVVVSLAGAANSEQPPRSTAWGLAARR
ncbi:uncharacterized protein TrAtP1_004155 [Trichoderma atroviride]|uniref:uncharacterized protein n=1 Tax=Hypocrea atroviridis TaxID=63577 RepID=UPI0033196896|nr:hypothetical protein TrAtP1_004155 [Trichoderma atroviride]